MKITNEILSQSLEYRITFQGKIESGDSMFLIFVIVLLTFQRQLLFHICVVVIMVVVAL